MEGRARDEGDLALEGDFENYAYFSLIVISDKLAVSLLVLSKL